MFLLAGGCGEEAPQADGSHPAPALTALLEAGKDAYYAGSYGEADSLFRALETAAGRRDDSLWVSRALTWRGLTARRRGAYGTAERLAGRGLRLGLRSGLSDEPLFRAYNAMGLVAWERGRLHEADSLYRLAREVAAAAGDSASLAKAASNLALVRKDLGQFSEARASLERAFALARSQGDAFVEGRVLDNLAMLEVDAGDPSRAIDLLERAREIHRRAGDAAGETYLLAQLGVAYAAIGEPGRGIAYLDSAAARAREQGDDAELAHDLLLLAELHQDAGRPRRALQLLAEAATVHRESGLTFEVASDLRAEAEVFAGMGDLERATERARRSLALYREVDARYQELQGRLFLAELRHRAGARPAALRHLEAARRLATEIDARPARVRVALAAARMADREGRPRDALRLLDPVGLELERSDSWTRWEYHRLRARAFGELDRTDAAVAAGREAVTAIERTRRSYGGIGLRSSYLAARREAYGALADLHLARGEPAEALRVADAARGRALLDRLHQVRPGDDPDGRPALRALAGGGELLSRSDSLVHRLEGIALVPEAEREPELEAERRALEADLRRARSAYASALVDARVSDPVGAGLLGAGAFEPERFREALRPGEVLLEFFVADERLHLFVLSPAEADGLRVFTRETAREELASRVRVARDLLARPERQLAARRAVLEGLHELLIAPARRAGALDDARRLVVASHDVLTYLPMGALRDPATGRYLVEDHPILHVPSAAGLVALRREAARAREAGDPAGSPAAPAAFVPFPDALPGSTAEGEAIRRSFPAAEVYRAGEATEPRFRRALGTRPVVHAATHGVLNAWNPLFSRIELAPSGAPDGGAAGRDRDGRLEAHELLSLEVRSRLVVLSGCETGVGVAGATTFAPGEDYLTLASALLFAGAEDVVATLWRVRDDAAAALAGRFLAALPDRAPPEALARAQRALIAEPTTRAPYFWAGYRLVGGGPSPPLAQSGGPLPVLEN